MQTFWRKDAATLDNRMQSECYVQNLGAHFLDCTHFHFIELITVPSTKQALGKYVLDEKLNTWH